MISKPEEIVIGLGLWLGDMGEQPKEVGVDSRLWLSES